MMSGNFTLSCCSTVDLPYSRMAEREIPVLFYTYSGVLGKSPDWINIAIFYITVLLVFLFVTNLLICLDE